MKRHLQQGFTLVELLVTLSVAAILLSLALPSFNALVNSNRLTAQANDLLGALMIARSEAIRLNQRVILCRSDNGTTCSTSTDGWQGWLVFADANSNDTPETSEILRTGTISASTMTVVGSANISGQTNRIRTGADGFARAAIGSSAALLQAKLSVCIPTYSVTNNTREITITAGGRAMVTQVNNAGSCPTPSNS